MNTVAVSDRLDNPTDSGTDASSHYPLSAASILEPDDPPAVRYDLPPGLVHGIESIVVPPTSPRVRSAAISSVVEEMYQTLAWAHGKETEQIELASLAQVLAAACAHEARMAALQGGEAPCDDR